MALAVPTSGGNSSTTGLGATATSSSYTSTTASLIANLGPAYNTSGSAAGTDHTDSKTNGYTLATSNLGGAASPGISCGYNNAGTRGTSHTESYNGPGAGESNNVAWVEVTGQDPTAPYDTTTPNINNGTSGSLTVTTLAAVNGNQIVIAAFTVDTGADSTFTAPTAGGWTVGHSLVNGSTNLVHVVYWKIFSNPGTTVTCDPTWNGTLTAWRGLIVSFKEAASGPVAPPGSFVLAPKRFWVPAGRKLG